MSPEELKARVAELVSYEVRRHEDQREERERMRRDLRAEWWDGWVAGFLPALLIVTVAVFAFVSFYL